MTAESMDTGVRAGRGWLMLGDCLERLEEIEDRCVDLVIADLPYGTTSNKWDSVLPMDRLWETLLRVSTPTAALCFTASQPFTSLLVMSRPALFRHEWIWRKNAGSNFANTKREPMKEHESVLVFSRGGWKYRAQMQERAEAGKARVKHPVRFDSVSENYNSFEGRPPKEMPELRVPSSVQEFRRERGLHPTQKPLALMKYLVSTYSDEEDLVLDPTMGSGTTGVAALDLNRRFLGVEKNLAYYEGARQRMETPS